VKFIICVANVTQIILRRYLILIYLDSSAVERIHFNMLTLSYLVTITNSCPIFYIRSSLDVTTKNTDDESGWQIRCILLIDDATTLLLVDHCASADFSLVYSSEKKREQPWLGSLWHRLETW
jgi:hypothetical protein